jgi:uncharacterized protein YbgA (DUF1722 family)/uncharacterized protein YbbK (DUF523 family)
MDHGTAETAKIPIGVSACLLGENVRYDGGHKRDPYIVETLGRFLRFVPVCPEVGCGLPVPREAMHLTGDPAAPRLVTIRSGRDMTEQMQAWCRHQVEVLAREELCGFIFKKNSPSSGLFRVKVYGGKGMPAKTGRGLFARAVTDRFPLLPVEEEGRLNDPELRENFIERVFAWRRWRAFLQGGVTTGRLVEFHTEQKLLMMAHSPEHYRLLGRLVAGAAAMAPDRAASAYEELYMAGLARLATVRKNYNVLLHCAGYFRKLLDQSDRQELLAVMERYLRREVPLIVPITLLRHHIRRSQVHYLARQTWLEPSPPELMLRNHA